MLFRTLVSYHTNVLHNFSILSLLNLVLTALFMAEQNLRDKLKVFSENLQMKKKPRPPSLLSFETDNSTAKPVLLIT